MEEANFVLFYSGILNEHNYINRGIFASILTEVLLDPTIFIWLSNRVVKKKLCRAKLLSDHLATADIPPLRPALPASWVEKNGEMAIFVHSCATPFQRRLRSKSAFTWTDDAIIILQSAIAGIEFVYTLHKA